MRIFVLYPFLGDANERQSIREKTLEELSRILASDVELRFGNVDRGSATIECFYDWYLGTASMLERASEAERDGFDAVVVNCFLNPALEGLRELLQIPVVAAGEAAVHLASMLGDNFAILDTDPPPRSYSHKTVSSLGLTQKLRSVRYLSLGVEGISGGFKEILDKMTTEAFRAVEEDGAHVIVLGCTGMRRYAEKLGESMEPYGVPVVEPLTAAINFAALLVRLRLKHSKLSYPDPPEKKRIV